MIQLQIQCTISQSKVMPNKTKKEKCNWKISKGSTHQHKKNATNEIKREKWSKRKTQQTKMN